MSSTLFTWRGCISGDRQIDWDIAYRSPDHFEQFSSIPKVYGDFNRQCPFCRIPYIHDSACRCGICGFTYSFERGGDYYGEGSNVDWYTERVSTIKKFDISSSEIAFPELATHLKRKPDDYYALAPRRFEELIADVYRHLGFEVELTQQTHDEGIDVVILNNRKIQQVVQCKRNAATRKIGVGVVREILGVALYTGVSRATIVATSSFSEFATRFAADVNERLSPMRIDLLDASSLVASIGAYNVTLPPLHLNPILEDLKAAQETLFTSSARFHEMVVNEVQDATFTSSEGFRDIVRKAY